jgi:hypothetical protein
VFQPVHAGVTHAAVFYEIKWVALEIRDVKRIPSRDVSNEKTGDYYFEEVMKPRNKWGFNGIELSIIKDDTTAYSEKIYDVVLRHQSRDRQGFKPIRDFSFVRTTENQFVVEGIIFFSLPAEPVPPVEKIVAKPVSSEIAIATAVPSIDTPIINYTEAERPSTVAPVTLPKSGCFSSASGCLTGGCLGSIGRLMRWFFIAFLFIKFVGILSSLLSDTVRSQRQETREGRARTEKRRLDHKQDTLAPQPWNYLVDHEVNWDDFSRRSYLNKYTTSTLEFAASNKRHNAWAKARIKDELLFYHDLYDDLNTGDRKKLDSLTGYFVNERRRKNLDPLATAEMVVTFVQEIPYVLVHEGTCREAISSGGFAAEYHLERKPCLPDIVAGVQSPYEFAHTLEGDCDTRSLLAYTLLDQLGIGASIWVSREYGHSVLGVAVPANSSNYKRIGGIRYFATELTSKGFRVGMIAPEHTDMDNWTIVLNNR